MIETWIVELCAKHARNLLGFTAKNRYTYPGQYNEAAWVVLGMGDDGHTASLFPNSPNLDDGLAASSPHRCLPMLAPSVPHQRLSMTRTLLTSAGFIALAVQGPNKLATLRAALAGNDLTEMPIRAFLHDPLDIYWCP